MRLHLIVARNVVERCFEDQKQEVGLDQWEGRRWLGLKRHLMLTSASYLFLARVRTKFRGKKPDLTISQVHAAVGALVPSWWLRGRASAVLIEDMARRLRHWQQRIAAARVRHIKRTRKKPRQMGIYLKDVIRCKWP